jgi:hypothetical protein
MAQAKYSNSVARFMISSKNGSQYKSNHPKWRRSNFKPLAFREYFVFSCLIRKGTNLGPPDLESSQKGISSDTHIVYFGPHPICLKIPPPNPIGHITTLRQTLQCSLWQQQGYITMRVQGLVCGNTLEDLYLSLLKSVSASNVRLSHGPWCGIYYKQNVKAELS